MCGRYFLKLNDTYEAFIRLKNRCQQLEITGFSEGEIFPSQPVLALFPDGEDHYRPNVVKWGMDIGKPRLIINARHETMNQRSAFRPYVSNRCVIPADGFYEWKKINGRKHKIFIERSNGPMFMAGLCNHKREMVIITGASQDEMADVHDRSPFLMNEQEMLSYLYFHRGLIMNDQYLKFTDLDRPQSVQIPLF
ncbi:MAG: SOS response-associated peptidase family protein [Erysipelotrichaceae bacterium]|nr:SOS response-associated peptidase family protein [Erysipelotrichaceae bacterium]